MSKRYGEIWITSREAAYLRRFVQFLAFDNGLSSLYEDNKWLWVFLQTGLRTKSSQEVASIFKPAKDEFRKRPARTVELLEHFTEDLCIQELIRSFLIKLARMSKRHRECWLSIQTMVQSYLKAFDPTASTLNELGPLVEQFQAQASSPSEHSEAAQQICDFAIEQQHRYEGIRLKTGNDSLEEDITKILEQSSEAWPEETRWICKAFEEFGPDAYIPTDHATEVLLTDLFKNNLSLFTEQVTGYYGGLPELRQNCDEKKDQWNIFFDTMDKLQSEITGKQHIITCVGYRHILEQMPNKDKLMILFPGASLSTSTGNWKLAWQVIVEVELYDMLQEFVDKLHPGRLLSIPSAPDSTDPRWFLRRLLQVDFKFWGNAMKHRVHIKSNLVAIQAAKNGIAAQTSSASPHTTNFTVLFDKLHLDYSVWQVYQRGLGMFNELSNSIHGYDKLFQVDETNWAKSDWLILKYLTPRLDTTGTMDWDSNRKLRGLPF